MTIVTFVFYRENLEWLARATNWAKFTATASLGVIHRVSIIIVQGSSLMNVCFACLFVCICSLLLFVCFSLFQVFFFLLILRYLLALVCFRWSVACVCLHLFSFLFYMFAFVLFVCICLMFKVFKISFCFSCMFVVLQARLLVNVFIT